MSETDDRFNHYGHDTCDDGCNGCECVCHADDVEFED